MLKRVSYIVLGILILMCLGTIYSWSVFKGPISISLSSNGETISSLQSNLPFMVFLLAYAFSMPFAGMYIEKLGPRLITIIGGIIFSSGWIISSFLSNIFLITLAYGLLGGMGVGIIYGAPVAVSAKWFPKKKGLAVGLTLLGFGLSPFVTARLAKYLLNIYNNNVFMTFRVLGIAFLIIILILGSFLKFPEKTENSKEEEDKLSLNVKEMMKTGQFKGLWFCFLLGTLIGLMIIGISSPAGMELVNLDSNKAAFMVSFFAIFNGIGRPLFGLLTDKFTAKKSALISYLMIIIASLMIIFKGHNFIVFSLAFSIFWLNLGGWLAIVPAATNNLFGHKHYSKNYGIVFTAYGIGALLGGFISGEIRDIFGSYIYIFYPVIVFAVIGIIVSQISLHRIIKR